MWRFGRCSLLPNYTSGSLQAKLLIRERSEKEKKERESLVCPSFFFCLVFLMGHSIIIVHSSFFFHPDLDLCGLPAWLLPWQHLEPSFSCWPYVFTEAQACSSLLRGCASPSKVSSYTLTPLTEEIVLIVSFNCLGFPTKSPAHTENHAHTHACIHTSSYVSSLYICKERISCHMPNSTILKTKGGYYVWLVSGGALRQSFLPTPKNPQAP